MMQSAIPTASTASVASVQQSLMKPAAAQEGNQASAWKEGPEGVTVAPSASSDAIVTSKTAKTKDVDAAARLNNSLASIPKYHVQSLDESYEVFGVDAIWHNQYAGPKSDFLAFRKQYHCDINAMIFKVTEHVRKGVYTVISINGTPHMLTVICGCEIFQADFPGDIYTRGEAFNRIKAQRSDLTSARITDEHWELFKEEKEAMGHDRETYEIVKPDNRAPVRHALQLGNVLSSQSAAIPGADGEMNHQNYLFRLGGILGSKEKVMDIAVLNEVPKVVEGQTEMGAATFCVVDETKVKIETYLAQIQLSGVEWNA